MDENPDFNYNPKLLSDANHDMNFDCRDNDTMGLYNYYVADAPYEQRTRQNRTIVFQDGERTMGYVSLSMSDLYVSKSEKTALKAGEEQRNYPSIYVSRLAVDNNYRGMHKGISIMAFCVGFAVYMSKYLGCKFLVLYTNKHWHTYYRDECGFTLLEEIDGVYWMLRKITHADMGKYDKHDQFLQVLKSLEE